MVILKVGLFCCIANVTWICIIWRERNARFFKDSKRSLEVVWDLFYFSSFLWASTNEAFVEVYPFEPHSSRFEPSLQKP